MSPRQAVQAAFRFKQVEPVPYWLQWDKELDPELDEYFGSCDWRKRVVPYVVGRHFGHREKPVSVETSRDAFGTVFRIGNILHVEQPVLPEPSLKGYRWPKPDELIDWNEIDAFLAPFPDSFRTCGLAMGLFERSWLMRGFENILVDMMLAPDFVHELLDGILDLHLRVMDRIVARVPLDAYFGGDDWCDQRTVMMGLDLWRRFFKPRLQQMIRHCHELGLAYVLHSCGNVAPLVDDLLEIGLDGLESLQAESMNVYKLKRKVAGRMVLIGGMGVQRLIPFGTPDEIREETRRLIRELGEGGGYVLGPSKPIPAGTPIPNAAAFIETAMRQNACRP
ncbi:MAG: uroporphyrinogen decarboxylase family protein [Phycisphaerae bacterium]